MKLLSNSKDDGFTHIEVISAIFIISLSSFLLFSGFNLVSKTLDKTNNTLKLVNELSSLENEFKKAVSSIEVDFWEMERKLDIMEFYQEDGKMFFRIDEQLFQYNLLRFDSINYNDSRAELTIETSESIEMIILANWGSFYFGNHL